MKSYCMRLHQEWRVEFLLTPLMYYSYQSYHQNFIYFLFYNRYLYFQRFTEDVLGSDSDLIYQEIQC